MEREGKSIDLAMTFPPGSLGVLRWIESEVIAIAIFTFGLALIIGVRRPRESVARIAAWLMATIAVSMVLVNVGWASFWRHLPSAFGLFLWPAAISSTMLPAIGITFAIIFPRVVIRNRLLWLLIWLPGLKQAAPLITSVKTIYQQ